MKSFFWASLTLITLHSCRLNTKINPVLPNTFESIETQMAEIKAEEPQPQIEVSKKDSVEFVKFWELFYGSYKKNDTPNLIRLSFDSVDSPIFNEKENRFQQKSEHISINYFLKMQILNNPAIVPYPISLSDQSFITYRYEYNNDAINNTTKNNSIILKFRVLVNSKEVKGNYEFQKLLFLIFIKKDNSIKFSGMEVFGESYPILLNDSVTISKLYFPLYRETQTPTTNLIALDTFPNLWYSNSLSEFKEQNLYSYSGKNDVYRFTWLRSFHNPVVIRFEKHEDEYILTTKEMIDNEGYIPNEFIVNTSRSLSTLTWNDWEIKLGRMNFWNMATLDPESRPTDGADWILEAKINGKYHFVTRYNYDPYFRECCKYLLKISRLKIRDEDIY